MLYNVKNKIENLKTNKIKLDLFKINKINKIKQSLQVHRKYKIDNVIGSV